MFAILVWACGVSGGRLGHVTGFGFAEFLIVPRQHRAASRPQTPLGGRPQPTDRKQNPAAKARGGWLQTEATRPYRTKKKCSGSGPLAVIEPWGRVEWQHISPYN